MKLLRNRWLYTSHVIHELMSSEREEEEKHLLYLVLSMDQVHLLPLCSDCFLNIRYLCCDCCV